MDRKTAITQAVQQADSTNKSMAVFTLPGAADYQVCESGKEGEQMLVCLYIQPKGIRGDHMRQATWSRQGWTNEWIPLPAYIPH